MEAEKLRVAYFMSETRGEAREARLHSEIRCCIINGGTDMREQRSELEGPGGQGSRVSMLSQLSPVFWKGKEKDSKNKIVVVKWCLSMI